MLAIWMVLITYQCEFHAIIYHRFSTSHTVWTVWIRGLMYHIYSWWVFTMVFSLLDKIRMVSLFASITHVKDPNQSFDMSYLGCAFAWAYANWLVLTIVFWLVRKDFVERLQRPTPTNKLSYKVIKALNQKKQHQIRGSNDGVDLSTLSKESAKPLADCSTWMNSTSIKTSNWFHWRETVVFKGGSQKKKPTGRLI